MLHFSYNKFPVTSFTLIIDWWLMQRNRGKQRMGKTRDLFKKIRDTKGTFHAKTETIKDRNCMDLTETEGFKKWWQEYTEELYKKYLQEPDNHDGVITHF